MSSGQQSRLGATFARLAAEKRAAFIGFFVAGDPDLATSAEVIRAAVEAGADVIEIGVPFSDPIADGPVIQAAFNRALERGFRVEHVFDLARLLRAGELQAPLVCMVSYTLVFKRGLSDFLQAARAAGFDGVIIPDLPAGYDDQATEQAAAAGLDLIWLVSPATPAERRALIASRAKGFLYYVSVAGVTGARTGLPPDLVRNVRALQALTPVPVCVGFGISQAAQVAEIGTFADGIIVGSALVKKVDEAAASGLKGPAVAAAVAGFISGLRSS